MELQKHQNQIFGSHLGVVEIIFDIILFCESILLCGYYLGYGLHAIMCFMFV